MTPRAVVAPAADTVLLRQQVLRPHETVAALAERDRLDEPDAVHVAVRADDGSVVATGNVRRVDPPWPRPGGVDGSQVAWRIRGMATAEGWRGRGLGTAVLAALCAHVAGEGGGFVWCNARVGALTLYQRAGFTPIGERFAPPDIGEHQAMWRAVAATS